MATVGSPTDSFENVRTPASARQRAGERVDRNLGARDAHAAQARRPLARADGEQVAAEARVCAGVNATATASAAVSQMPDGTSSPRPFCAVRSRSFSHVAGASSRRSPDSPLAAPRTSSIVPSVTMNGTTRSCVTSTPFSAPQAAPAATRTKRRDERAARARIRDAAAAP